MNPPPLLPRIRRRWLVLLVLAVLSLGVMWWLLGSVSGLRFLLGRVAAGSPELQLSIAAVEGRVLGPLRLGDLRLQVGQAALHVDELQLEWQPLQLLWGELPIQRLHIGAVAVTRTPVAATQAAGQFPAWRWPALSPPVAVRVQQLQIGRLLIDGVPQWRQLTAALHWQRDGRVQIERLLLQGEDWKLDAEGGLPAADTAPLRWQWQAATGAQVRGELEVASERVLLRLTTGVSSTVVATLDQRSQWTLQGRLDRADLVPWWPQVPEVLALSVDAQGDAAGGTLQASVATAALDIQSIASDLRWDLAAQRLQWSALTLRPRAGGQLQSSGSLQWSASPSIELQARADGLVLPGPSALRLDGDLGVAGALTELTASLQGRLSREQQTASIDVRVRREAADWVIEAARIEGDPGVVSLSGRYRPEPAWLQAQLQAERFDVAWLDPQLHGQLQAKLQVEARQIAGQWSGRVRLEQLTGDWLGHSATGRGELEFSQPAGLVGVIDLGIGRSRLTWRGLPAGQVSLQLRPLYLQEVWPQVAGRVQGELAIDDLQAPTWLQMDLQADQLLAAGLRLPHAWARGRLARTGTADFQLDWRGLQVGEMAPIDGELRTVGALDGYRLQLQANSAARWLRLGLSGADGDTGGHLAISALQLGDPQAGEWQLRAPSRIDYGAHWQSGEICLDSSPASLCLDAFAGDDVPLRLRLSLVPLARILGPLQRQPRLRGEGDLAATLMVQHGADGWQPVSLEATLDAGELRQDDPESTVLLRWNHLQLLAHWVDGQSNWQAVADLGEDGRVDARARLPWAGSADFSGAEGELQLDVRRLPVLQLFAPDLVQADGRLSGRLFWRGGDAVPLQGAVELSGLRGNIPALGIELSESSLSLHSEGDRLAIDGLLHTGGGPIRLQGSLDSAAEPSAQLRIAATDALLADTRSLRLRASPDLQAQWSKDGLRLRGSVEIPSARLDLERLESGVARSADVHVLDPREAEQGAAAISVDADIELRLGPAVELVGFGFDGGVGGALRVRDRPGRVTEGRGTLDLRGSYRAYGQDLAIQHGRLLFAGGPIDNPGIDLRASRKLQQVEVGIEVRGAARRPQLSLWSQPPLDQAEALSYLVLGRPLRSASAADGAQLGQAAAAMGGNLLAAQIGGRLGFDTFGVADSQSLGGAAFTVGKYLSPKLYLSYGVALFDSGSAVTLKYLLSEHFDVEIESARESRAAINARIERD